MNTRLIKVNEYLTVYKILESKECGLYQNIENAEFVVWYKDVKGGYCNGFYTFNLKEGIKEFERRKELEIRL